MCEVELTDFTPHPTNTRAFCVDAAEKYADQSPMFGIEQEYTFLQNGRPLGWPENGFPAPQGPYYCGVGGEKMVGRGHHREAHPGLSRRRDLRSRAPTPRS